MTELAENPQDSFDPAWRAGVRRRSATCTASLAPPESTCWATSIPKRRSGSEMAAKRVDCTFSGV